MKPYQEGDAHNGASKEYHNPNIWHLTVSMSKNG